MFDAEAAVTGLGIPLVLDELIATRQIVREPSLAFGGLSSSIPGIGLRS